MNIPKIKIPHSKQLTLSKKKITRLANKIITERYKKGYKEIDEDYWCITVSPTGEIFLQEPEYRGHPDMAQKTIFPRDEALKVLYEYFFPDELDNDVKMSYFMVLYGYINLDGYFYVDKVTCRYNSKAITYKTRPIIDNMKEYAGMEDWASEELCTEEDTECAKKVAFFGNELKRILRSKYPDIDINILLKKMKKEKIKEILCGIEKEYIDRKKMSEKDCAK